MRLLKLGFRRPSAALWARAMPVKDYAKTVVRFPNLGQHLVKRKLTELQFKKFLELIGKVDRKTKGKLTKAFTKTKPKSNTWTQRFLGLKD